MVEEGHECGASHTPCPVNPFIALLNQTTNCPLDSEGRPERMRGEGCEGRRGGVEEERGGERSTPYRSAESREGSEMTSREKRCPMAVMAASLTL